MISQSFPIILEHHELYLATKFSEDSSQIIVASGDSNSDTLPQIISWNTANWKQIFSIYDTSRHKNNHFSIHPSLPEISFGDSIWNCADQTSKFNHKLEFLEFSPNGRFAAGVFIPEDSNEEDEDGEPLFPLPQVHLMELETGKIIRKYYHSVNDYEIYYIRFIEHGKIICAYHYEYDRCDKITFWNVESGDCLTTFDLIELVVDSWEVFLEISQSGNIIYSTQGEVQIWYRPDSSYTNWKKHHSFRGHAWGVYQSQLSSDESMMFTMGPECDISDKSLIYSVRSWSISTGLEQNKFTIPEKCFCFCVSPDGNYVAAMSGAVDDYFHNESEYYTLHFWNSQTGELIVQRKSIAIHTTPLYESAQKMQFSPDGNWIAVTHFKHIEVWSVADLTDSNDEIGQLAAR